MNISKKYFSTLIKKRILLIHLQIESIFLDINHVLRTLVKTVKKIKLFKKLNRPIYLHKTGSSNSQFNLIFNAKFFNNLIETYARKSSDK
jgi:hypothetical protein